MQAIELSPDNRAVAQKISEAARLQEDCNQLFLSGQKLTDPKIGKLCTQLLELCVTLRVIDLSDNQITAKGVAELSKALVLMPSITKLSLAQVT